MKGGTCALAIDSSMAAILPSRGGRMAFVMVFARLGRAARDIIRSTPRTSVSISRLSLKYRGAMIGCSVATLLRSRTSPRRMRTALIYAKGETMLLRQPLQYAFADAAHQTDAQLHLNIRYAHVRFGSEEPSGRNHAIGQDATTEQEILYTGARRSKKVDMFIGGNWFRDSELHPVRNVVLQIGSDSGESDLTAMPWLFR